jgi:hypothetical protein
MLPNTASQVESGVLESCAILSEGNSAKNNLGMVR